jgi:hypothetical protein
MTKAGSSKPPVVFDCCEPRVVTGRVVVKSAGRVHLSGNRSSPDGIDTVIARRRRSIRAEAVPLVKSYEERSPVMGESIA